MLSKLLTIGPITALHYHDEYDNDDIGNNEEKGLLFVGIGGILNVIRNTLTSNSITNSFTILETDSIFGIKSIEKKIYKESNLLVYGGKSIAILEFNRNINEIGVNIKCKFNELDDLVLDSSIVYDESNILLVIGYAHNFIDIVTLADTEVKSNINKFFKRRIQCSELCCLFSLALNVDDINNIIIVSGTVFGKIIIWKVKNNDSFDIIHRLSGHEGVIFNIKWNETKDKIVTVSDDRSVRVWDIISGNVLFIGWGHICRPWDSIFVTNIDNKDLIVTSSEEGTLKVWDINENKCICNLRGHACDIWRLIYLKEKHTIISGGNDGSIKIWYLLSYLLSCPDNIESTSKRLSIPKIINTQNVTDNDNNSSRRNNGICFLRISNDGRMIVVGFVEGRICTVLNSSHSDNMIWNDITTLDKQITCGDICIKSDNKMIILCGHIYGTISLLDIDHNKDQFNCVLSNYEGHPLRIINIWFIETDDGRDNSIMFLSASVKGHNKLWNILTDNKDHNVESVRECFTVSKQVATCSIIINSIITKTTILVIGDSRGNISIYCSESLTLLQYVAKAHGPDQLPVSYLHSFSSGFYSLGHDGFLNRYEEVCDIGNESILYKMASKLSCLPLKTPDQLIVSENKNNTAIYVCGYLGNVYIVWDIRNGHQLMRIEGGSWKRAHHCILSYIRTSNHFILPRIVFSCPIPCGMNTDLIINDSLPLFCNDDDIFDKFTGDSLSTPLQVGYPSLGKVGYCTVILNGVGILSNEKYILIGGEEGTVKVYRMLQQNSKNNFVFCEDLLMPFNAAVRCMDKLDYNTDYGYVIAGGGRLTYSIWKYLYRSTAGLNNFSLVCCGTILPNASQDHRILSISSYNIDIDNESKQNHFIAFGDSRGIVTISNIEDSALDIINEVQISSNGYPVLSSKTISNRDNSRKFVVGAFGDTSGNISILLLYYSDMNDEKCIPPVRLYKYNGHSMGTNTVDMIFHNDESDLLRFKICSGGDDQSITICNGTIHFENSSISTFKIDINSIEVLDSACGSALKGIKLLNSNDKWKSDMIISIGYDRRLSIWLHNEDNKFTCLRTINFVDAIDQYNTLLFSDDNIDKVSNHKLNLKWLFGTLVDIGDIGSLDVVFDKIYDHNETKYRVSISVIGEGLQYFTFDM